MLNIKTGWTKEQQPRIRVGRIIKDYFDKIIINENDYEKNHKTTLTALDNDSEKNNNLSTKIETNLKGKPTFIDFYSDT